MMPMLVQRVGFRIQRFVEEVDTGLNGTLERQSGRFVGSRTGIREVFSTIPALG